MPPPTPGLQAVFVAFNRALMVDIIGADAAADRPDESPALLLAAPAAS